jgi:hypothetical protein
MKKTLNPARKACYAAKLPMVNRYHVTGSLRILPVGQ